jgi:hypothetical protein
MTWLTLLLAMLATYRVARMLTQEDGPFDAFAQLRGHAGQRTWVGRGIHCVLCVSFWVAAVVTVLLAATGMIAWREVWLVWPGVAGGAVVVYQVVR